MFQFSTFALLKLWIHFRVTALIALPGFPIRISPGHSSFDNSPELFAVCYVLLRLSTPRHPPYALKSLIIHPTPSKPAGNEVDMDSSEILSNSTFSDTWFGINLTIYSPLISITFFSSDFKLPTVDLTPSRSARAPYTRIGSRCQYFFSKKCIHSVTIPFST